MSVGMGGLKNSKFRGCKSRRTQAWRNGGDSKPGGPQQGALALSLGAGDVLINSLELLPRGKYFSERTEVTSGGQSF